MIYFASKQPGAVRFAAAAAVWPEVLQGDEHLIEAALDAARLFRHSADRTGYVRPSPPAILVDALVLFKSGWRNLALRLLEQHEGINRLMGEYLFAASTVESAWKYQLCRAGIVRIAESPVWGVVTTVDLTRIGGGEHALDMTLKQIFRRIIESQSDFWGRRSGRGALRLVLADGSRGRRARWRRYRRRGRRSIEWRRFAQWCLERMAARDGWREVPVVLDN